MATLRRMVMVRHGETEGESSVRFHGRADVPLSDAGRAQLRAAARALHSEFFDLVVASPLSRSWEGARIVSGGAPVRIVPEFREIDFGRWEGLTAAEIEATDPVLYQDWQRDPSGFDYPGGEPRAEFRARVKEGLESLFRSGAASVLLVGHKGVIRTIGETLTTAALSEGPAIAGVVVLSCGSNGQWVELDRG